MVLDALHKAIAEHGSMQVVAGKRNKVVYVDQWRAAFEVTQIDKVDIKTRFDKRLTSLQNAKKVEVFDPFAWIIYSDDGQNDGDF